MAEMSKEELNIEEFKIKEEIVSFKEEILPSSTVEDTCTVNINKDVIKMENKGIQGKPNYFAFSYKKLRCFIINSIV
jgi:hypothetical protein